MYTLKKSLGQHFLHDENMCQKIVAQLSINAGMQLVEVGPGAGAISKYLIQIPDISYVAIEIDIEKVNYLAKTLPNLEVLNQDFLMSDKPFQTPFSVIGNFPYNISSQILFKMLDWKESVTQVVGMFQKEVAQRVAAPHGNKDYGILSVLVQTFFTVNYLFDVHENCFTPPPKVKSGVIKLENTGNPHAIQDFNKYKSVIKLAFGQRRKTLRNSLKAISSHIDTSAEVFNKRPEQLSVLDFVMLFKTYYS